jgi:hypothetical protein
MNTVNPKEMMNILSRARRYDSRNARTVSVFLGMGFIIEDLDLGLKITSSHLTPALFRNFYRLSALAGC